MRQPSGNDGADRTPFVSALPNRSLLTASHEEWRNSEVMDSLETSKAKIKSIFVGGLEPDGIGSGE